jgi:hypothetical protein
MRRRAAPVSYAASLVVGQQPNGAALPADVQPRQPDEAGTGQGRGRRPLEDAADPSVLYLHPVGKKALRLYAVERGVKVHDLLIEAVEEWAAGRGLAGPWRVPSSGPPRRRRS